MLPLKKLPGHFHLMFHTCQRKRAKSILCGFMTRVHTTQPKTHQLCGGRKAHQTQREKDGYLALSDEQYEFELANTDDDVYKSACAILEIGEQCEGYWKNDRFMEQMAKAVKIAEVKYPSSQGYHHIWC